MVTCLQAKYKWLLAVVRYSEPGWFASKKSPVLWWWMSCTQTVKVTSGSAGLELNGKEEDKYKLFYVPADASTSLEKINWGGKVQLPKGPTCKTAVACSYGVSNHTATNGKEIKALKNGRQVGEKTAKGKDETCFLFVTLLSTDFTGTPTSHLHFSSRKRAHYNSHTSICLKQPPKQAQGSGDKMEISLKTCLPWHWTSNTWEPFYPSSFPKKSYNETGEKMAMKNMGVKKSGKARHRIRAWIACRIWEQRSNVPDGKNLVGK